MKNIKYGESKHNRTRSNVAMHTKTVTIQGNITEMRYGKTSFGRFFFISVGTGFRVMSRG